ncbi:nibrin-like [Anopheles marshallii]|uniref:nibrin-like n=1 Tax=Anopheles marshallii TaxID=1521116 RepID=UPI00237A1E6A|nr:nibrin-like [Anopheles marshallii]
MWYLRNINTEHVYYLVSQPVGHTVGRAGTGLIITGDESISRYHAMLWPINNVLHLIDTGSKYGSYVNDNIAKNVRISKEQATALKPGDKIRFGLYKSIWLVEKVDFRCLTSMLFMDNGLKTILDQIGAELVSTYTEGVTHLIMPPNIMHTKFLECLAGQVQIVSPEFFQTIARDCIVHGKALPLEKDFTPAYTGPYMRYEPKLLHRNPSRSNLFTGKEFIFLSTVQFRHFENVVKIAGGVCLCASDKKILKSRFVEPNVIVIKLNSSSTTHPKSVETLSQYLTSHRRRMVLEVEIEYALIFCSTEKFCNPDYNFLTSLAKSTKQDTVKSGQEDSGGTSNGGNISKRS